MLAGDLLLARARPWLADRRSELMRALAPLPGIAMAWWLSAAGLPTPVWLALVAYGAVQFVLYVIAWRTQIRTTAFALAARGWLSIATDALLGLVLVTQSEALGVAIFPLYLLIALRVLASYAHAPFATVTPFVLGPVYLFAGVMAGRQPPLSSVEQLSNWAVLLASLGFGAVAIWASAARQSENSVLRQQLRAERQNREARVEELERITNELRARMRERHALEEGLRVITSTLSLDEVLTQIVDSTVHTFGQERIHAMSLSLELDDVMKHHPCSTDAAGQPGWAEPLARRVMAQQVPVIAADAALDAEMAAVVTNGMRSVLSVPLFVGDGPARGALTVVSTTFAAFSSSDARHLAAFASQAGIAIANAELHSRLHSQQRLLEAVMRDINDGLVVFDGTGRVVLANPIGQRLLEAATATRPVAEQLSELADSVRTDGGMSSAASELKISAGEDEEERYYQAFASLVHRDDSVESLTAIVLHDITSQKAEEKARVEFISMVSHELRNPLHSLNGFVKVVLQGRAGDLTSLQQDFLQMADTQIEQLKGRIAELLEFNRLKAGRLSLNPQWSDLSLLVHGTINRLSLQAEERGITLVNHVDRELPECWCDSARIGQVVTNLVENAIKATPGTGTITVSSEVHDDDVWVRVRDTGVGIPAADLGKIFQRFYRVAKHTSGPDNHLGLGLAICQQIVEGHGGRMWVESEEGVGTCFTFALPLVPNEQLVAN